MVKRILASSLLFLAAAYAAEADVILSVSGTAPAENVVAFNDTASTQNISVRNQTTLTDRTLGQSFTVVGAVDINRVTLQMGSGANDFTADPDATLWLAVWDVGTDTQIGPTTSYDMSTFTSTINNYLTFEFDALSLPAAGEYAFEMGWQEDGSDTFDDDALNFSFRRTSTGDVYTGGGQILGTNYTSFPNPTLNPNANADLDFYVQAVPEPSTLVMLGLGVLALHSARRRSPEVLSYDKPIPHKDDREPVPKARRTGVPTCPSESRPGSDRWGHLSYSVAFCHAAREQPLSAIGEIGV